MAQSRAIAGFASGRRRAGDVPAARWPAATLLSLTCLAASAQEAVGGGAPGRLTANVDASVSYTSNSRASGQDNGDLVAQFRPGFQYSSTSGRVRGFLSYSLGFLVHSRSGRGSEVQNSLAAAFTAEAVENFAYVDVNAQVSQRSISPFGQQSPADNLQANPNRTEIATLSVAPNVRGRLADLAVYTARVDATLTSGRHFASADSTSTAATLAVNSARQGTLLGWGVQYSRHRSDFRAGRPTEGEQATVSLTSLPHPDLSLSARAGRETTDVGSADNRSYDNWGVGARWTPTARTVVSVDVDRRYFGNSHSVTVQHRLAHSAFSFTSVRDVSNNASPGGVGQPQTLYQLYFIQFASAQPDPVLREQLVLAFLNSIGKDPNAAVGGGFVNSAVTLQQHDNLGWTYAGLRTVFSLQAFSSRSRIIDTLPPQADPNTIRQTGLTASATYRLTPTSTATLVGSMLRTMATPANPGNDLQSLALSWGDQIGLRTSFSVTGRYSVFNSTADPYHEKSVSAALSHRF